MHRVRPRSPAPPPTVTSPARPFAAAVAAVLGSLLLGAAPANAGGLVWSLPAPGTFVRHEGTLSQTITDRQNQTRTVERLRQITVRALDAETATVDGRPVPARWLEVVSETGTPGERGLDTGPVGRVLYKVLVPEAAVTGRVQDDQGIPDAFLPVLRGWKQTGDGEPIEFGPALRAYPTLTLLKEYEPGELTEEGPDAADTPAGSFDGTLYRGKVTEETRRARVVNEGAFLVSDAVPFGVARWEVTVTQERKDLSEPREAFREVSKTVERLSVHEVGDNARGELPLP